MFMRVDKLQAELPAPKQADPNAAAALQELSGGATKLYKASR